MPIVVRQRAISSHVVKSSVDLFFAACFEFLGLEARGFEALFFPDREELLLLPPLLDRDRDLAILSS